MAAGNSNFFTITNACAVNGTYTAAGGVSFSSDSAMVRELATAGYVTPIDFNNTTAPGLAGLGLAKGAGVALTLSGTTPITLNLALLAADATNGVLIAGDTVFATINFISFRNVGAGSVSWAPGAANGLTLGVTAVNSQVPSIAIGAAANGVYGKFERSDAAGYTVNATNKNITLTPAANSTLIISIGGA